MENLNFVAVDVLLSLAGLLGLFAVLFDRSRWRLSAAKVRVFWAATGGVGLTSLVNQVLRPDQGWSWWPGTGGALLMVLCAVAGLILTTEAGPQEKLETTKIRLWTLGVLLLADAALLAGAASPSPIAKTLLILGGCALLVVFIKLRGVKVQTG